MFKIEFRFSSEKLLVSLGERKLLKPEVIYAISKFDCLENEKHCKPIYRKCLFFYFMISTESCGLLLKKMRKKLGVILFLLFYCRDHKWLS